MGRKISVILSDEIYKGVEDFRRESPKEDGSVQTRGWAVETLIEMGLAAKFVSSNGSPRNLKEAGDKA